MTEDKRATGVEFSRGDALRQVRARREVVLAAGPLQSPKLLELSGIGNGEIQRRHALRTGTVGAALVAKAPVDGPALSLASQTTHAVTPYLYSNGSYDQENARWSKVVRDLALRVE